MPVYYICYTTKNDDHAIKHDIDWVTPGGWTAEQAIESFKQRHPEASITQFIQDPFYPNYSDQSESCQSLSSADSQSRSKGDPCKVSLGEQKAQR